MQVSFPHFRDCAFLQRAERRYRAFLFLMKHNRSAFLVPTYDIDLMWHAHQVCHFLRALDRLASWPCCNVPSSSLMVLWDLTCCSLLMKPPAAGHGIKIAGSQLLVPQ